jgi:hypothetical protein
MTAPRRWIVQGPTWAEYVAAEYDWDQAANRRELVVASDADRWHASRAELPEAILAHCRAVVARYRGVK